MQHFRASTLEDMKVRDPAGEDIGKIKDLVIDFNTGKVAYAALDFGGFLGFGEKYFAVPWNAFKYQTNGNEHHLVLNVTKEHLKNAPGFDKSHWPDMASPNWATEVDRFYGEHRTSAK